MLYDSSEEFTNLDLQVSIRRKYLLENIACEYFVDIASL